MDIDLVRKQVDSHIKELIVNRPTAFVPMAYKKPSFELSQISETVLIFKNLNGISCNQEKHTVVRRDVSILLSDMSGYVTLPVHECLDCHRIFIGYQTLKLYEQQYGILQLQRRPDASVSHDRTFAYMKESQLYQTGYNVIDGGFTQGERQRHLLALMTSHRMSRFGIIRDLEHAIHLFDGRDSHRLAVTKWKADLMFVVEAKLE